ncbi:M48 family metalloprotease [Halomonas sp. HMF6819]|uniref:M48 family metalloprotease n=1 Tax=Halomonas sp. HMF6819 TaxID=3373085 RepID=UPI00378F36B7
MSHRRFLQRSALAFTLVLASAFPTAQGQGFDNSQLPSLGGASPSASLEEFRLGRAWLRQFRAQAPQWQDAIAQDYLEGVVTRLTPYSQLGGLDTTTVMVDHRALNAFAVPGGVVGINSGLFAFAEDEGAFVSVIAHELGHLSQRHYARGSERAGQTQLPALAGLLAGMLIAASGGGDAGIATAMGSQAALIQDQLAYSRRFEQEADRVGLQAMAAAGFDPEAMVRMFASMQRLARLQGGTPPEFLLTHPVSDSRLSDAQARVAQLTVADSYQSNTLYNLMRARALLSLYQNAPEQAQSRLAQGGAEETARRYLSALIDARRGQVDTALQRLDALAAELPDYAMIPASAAQVALEANRIDEAITRAERWLRVMPNYLPAQLILAEAQLQRDPQAAFDLLRRVTERYPENPQGFNLLTTAAGRSGHNGWGHLAQAEYLQLTGRVDRGIQQLGIAKNVAQQEGDSPLVALIDQRREAFLDYREALSSFN